MTEESTTPYRQLPGKEPENNSFEALSNLPNYRTKQQRLQRLETLVVRSTDFIGIAALNGQVEYLNPAAMNLVGLTTMAEVQQKQVLDFFMPEHHQTLLEVVLPTVDRTGHWAGELEFRHFVTGKPIPVWYQIFSLYDPETGEKSGYATASMDLTVYKKAEEQYRFVTDAMPQLVWTTDPEGFHTFFNQQWVDYTGYSVEDSLGTEMWNNLLHPDDQARARAVWQHSLNTGEPYEIEYRFKRASDGAWRWFLGRALPMRDSDGRILKWFGTCTDIQSFKEMEAALREREMEFTGLADNIPQLAWMARPDGYIFWYNQRWLNYTGATMEEMLGDGWRKAHHPAHVDRVVQKYRQSFEQETNWEDVFPLRSSTGEYRWFLSRAQPIRDEHGKVLRWFGSNTDITEMRNLQDQLQNSYNDLEAKITFRTIELERQLEAAKARIKELEQQQGK